MNPKTVTTPGLGEPQFTRYDAAAIADARGVLFAPGSLLVEAQSVGPTVVAAGRPGDIDGVVRGLGLAEGEGDKKVARVSRRGARGGRGRTILIPGLVNAHTHLDLTHIGPHPHDPEEGFVAWIDLIRAGRHSEEAAIAESVRTGVELSLAGGVVAVGDIAGAAKATPNLAAWRVLRELGLGGVSFIEFFGIGKSWGAQPERVRRVLERAEGELTQRRGRAEDEQNEEGAGGSAAPSAPLRLCASPLRLGLQPHAPNTIDLRLYQWAVEEAARRGLPLSTHLAETREEREFIATASGPQREFLERIGLWDESVLDHVGRGLHPVVHLAPILAQSPFLIAHVNDATDEAIGVLARTGASVAYCPRASDYFAAQRHFGPHRYREMLAAGVNVCLGTDSIVNLPAASADPRRGGLSTLGEMRFLYRRDAAAPGALLAMATVNGARALGLDPDSFMFKPGSRVAGLVAIGLPESAADPLAAALSCDSCPELLLGGNNSCQTRKTAAGDGPAP